MAVLLARAHLCYDYSRKWRPRSDGSGPPVVATRVVGNPEVVLDDTIGRLIPALDAAGPGGSAGPAGSVEYQFCFRRQMAARYEALDEGGAPPTDTACGMPTVP